MAQIASLPTLRNDSSDCHYGLSGASVVPGPATLKTKPTRRPLPKHLPRYRVEHATSCICPACGGTRLTQIGTDEREVLEYAPSHFKVIVHVRPKLACRGCEAITQKPMPTLPIERGLPGPGLLARVIVAKHCEHRPLYRQSAFYARKGVDIDRSTLAGWVAAMSDLLMPLAEAIANYVRAGIVLHSDNRPVPVLKQGRGKAKKGYLRVMVRDERPLGSNMPSAVCYHYFPDCKAEQTQSLLKTFQGNGHSMCKLLDTSADIIERAIRPLIRDERSWLFAGSDIGGVRAATLHTLIESSRMNGFDPETYLRDIINCIAAAAGATSIDGSSASRYAVTVRPLDLAARQADLFSPLVGDLSGAGAQYS